MELLAVGYNITVDSNSGVIKYGPENIPESAIAIIPIMARCFLYA